MPRLSVFLCYFVSLILCAGSGPIVFSSEFEKFLDDVQKRQSLGFAAVVLSDQTVDDQRFVERYEVQSLGSMRLSKVSDDTGIRIECYNDRYEFTLYKPKGASEWQLQKIVPIMAARFSADRGFDLAFPHCSINNQSLTWVRKQPDAIIQISSDLLDGLKNLKANTSKTTFDQRVYNTINAWIDPATLAIVNFKALFVTNSSKYAMSGTTEYGEIVGGIQRPVKVEINGYEIPTDNAIVQSHASFLYTFPSWEFKETDRENFYLSAYGIDEPNFQQTKGFLRGFSIIIVLLIVSVLITPVFKRYKAS